MGSPNEGDQNHGGPGDHVSSDQRTSTPTLPAAPDPSKDLGVIPPVMSPAPEDEEPLEEYDIFVITPVAALKMLCRSVDTLVRFTGDIPPTPPARSRPSSPESGKAKAEEEQHGKENRTPQSSHSGDQIDGVPFTKTPIGSPEAHASEPFHDIGAHAEPIYVQQGAIIRKFYSKRPPPISPEDYLLRLHKYCPMSTAVYLATSLYMTRLAVHERLVPVTPRNVHRLLLAGLRVAMKALEDLCWPHGRFAKVGGVTEFELGRLEINFCFLMNFELRVDAEMLRSEVDNLRGSAVQDSPVSLELPMLPENGQGGKRKASATLPTRPISGGGGSGSGAAADG